MKRTHIAILAIVFTGLSLGSAHADHRAVNGMIIGAGSGAVLGQVLGGDTESTIAGTLVGTVAGLIIGSSLDQSNVHYVDHRPQVQHIYHPPPQREHKVRHHYPRHVPPKYKECTKVIKIKYNKHGVKKRVVTKTCYDRPYQGHKSHKPHKSHNHHTIDCYR